MSYEKRDKSRFAGDGHEYHCIDYSKTIPQKLSDEFGKATYCWTVRQATSALEIQLWIMPSLWRGLMELSPDWVSRVQIPRINVKTGMLFERGQLRIGLVIRLEFWLECSIDACFFCTFLLLSKSHNLTIQNYWQLVALYFCTLLAYWIWACVRRVQPWASQTSYRNTIRVSSRKNQARVRKGPDHAATKHIRCGWVAGARSKQCHFAS